MPSLAETPMWAAFTLGSHFSSSRTSRCSSMSVFMGGTSYPSGWFISKCWAGWLRPTGRVSRPFYPFATGMPDHLMARSCNSGPLRKAKIAKDLGGAQK